MDIRVSQTHGQIGIYTSLGKMSIESPKSKVSIEQARTDLQIDSEMSKVEIDQTECFAESGKKTVFRLANDFCKESVEKGLENIGKVAEEGRRLMEIENGGNAIARIAYENSFNEHEYGMVPMPKSRPKISWTKGYVDIRWRQKPLRIEWDVSNKVNINVTRSNVEIYMRQYPDIKIEYIGNIVDRQI